MKETIGFLGLGAMGFPMATNLIERGYSVIAWDPREDTRAAFCSKGGVEAAGQGEAASAEVVMISLPHSDVLVKVAMESLIPNVREGQVFVDFTTVVPGKVRALAEAFSGRGSSYLDCPVTGGPGGAEQRVLRVYAGGERNAFERVKPMLEATTEPEWVFYCGGSGCGQAVKGVNQLGMGLYHAAAMEAVHYGLAGGVSVETIKEAVGGDWGFRAAVKGICESIQHKRVKDIPIKYDQFEFFLNESKERGFSLPLVEFLSDLLTDEPRPILDANQYAPSYWDYLKQEASRS